MSWVSIDQEKCNKCGICAIRCMTCFYKQEDGISVYAEETSCNLCGHCVALCPQDAIRHVRLNRDNFLPVEEATKYDTDEFILFIRKRRSHRHFRDKQIPRAELEKLVEVCRYSPTGGNRQPVEIKVIQNRDKIQRLSSLTVDYFIELFSEMEAQIAAYQAEGKDVPEELSYNYDNLSRYKNLALARDLGMDVILYKAPAVMVFHAETPGLSCKDDCVIAAQTVTLTAMTMGLGSCYIGLFTIAAGAYAPLREELRLPDGHKVYSTLVMGYPKLKFLRTVDRKPIKVTWD